MIKLSDTFTFEMAKRLPRFNWIYYKEGFSPHLVNVILAKFDHAGLVYDPFCGVGTTLLAAKIKGWEAIGIDVSPLSILASSVKTRNYDADLLNEVLERAKQVVKYKEEMAKWEFELFPPCRAFPKRNFLDVCYIRQAIEALSEDRVKDFLLLALISIIPQCSWIVKDGGVLKLMPSKKGALPRAKYMFLRKVKRMVNEAREVGNDGKEPEVFLGDARQVVVERKADVIITSPPYLNNVDYSKVYGLELSLLTLDKDSTKKMRKSAISSFIFKDTQVEIHPVVHDLVGEDEMFKSVFKYSIVISYLSDMAKVFEKAKENLKDGGEIFFVVGDAFIFSNIIPVAELLLKIAKKIGFEGEIMETKWRTVSFNRRIVGKCGEHLIHFTRI